MQRTRRLTRMAVPLFFCAALVPAGAWARWYQVELLVFLNKDPTAIGTDHWLNDPGRPDVRNALALQAPRGPDQPFAQLPPARRSLGAHRRTMDRSGRYETLLHLAWLQPVTGERGAQTLYFQLPPPPADRSSDRGADLYDQPPGLVGTIRMTRGRFLHADLDVAYRERLRVGETAPAPYQATAAAFPPQPPPYRLYRLQEKRRMRSGHLHHMDHPAMGALILVTPVGGDTEAADGDGSDTPEETQTEPSEDVPENPPAAEADR